MSVEVNVYLEVALPVLVNYCFLREVNGLMVLDGWVLVEPIQILTEGIKAPVASSHSVGI